jgi:hypothetical protein
LHTPLQFIYLRFTTDPPIILEDDDDHIEVLRAFTPERSDSANGEGGRFVEVGTIANVMRMAIDLGIAR